MAALSPEIRNFKIDDLDQHDLLSQIASFEHQDSFEFTKWRQAFGANSLCMKYEAGFDLLK